MLLNHRPFIAINIELIIIYYDQHMMVGIKQINKQGTTTTTKRK